MHILHRQDARGAVIGDRLGDDDVLELAQVLANRGEIRRFLPVIELAQKAFAELIEHLAKLVALPGRGVVIEELRDLIERIEIFEHRVANPGPLHLHRHLPAVAQTRFMHLPKGGGGHRRDIEIRERFRHSDAELGGDDLLDLVERERLDLVLQPRERFEVSLRHQLDAGREKLAKLHEGRA